MIDLFRGALTKVNCLVLSSEKRELLKGTNILLFGFQLSSEISSLYNPTELPFVVVFADFSSKLI